MLVLRFEIDGQAYGLPCRDVQRVLPLVALRRVPLGPPYLVGLAQLEGSSVPVFDLSILAGGAPCPDRLSTRLILVRAPGPAPRTVALMAERVTETVPVEPTAVIPPAVNLPDAPFLEGLASDAGRLLQLIDVERLVPPEVMALLALEDGAEPPTN